LCIGGAILGGLRGWRTGCPVPRGAAVQNRVRAIFRDSAAVKLRFVEENAARVAAVAQRMAEVLRRGGKLLFVGNGGSAADAQHLAAEFVNRFQRDRRALAAIALTTDSSILTSIGNDSGFDQVFSRQVEALGRPGDLLVAISTSGNSVNVVRAVEAGRGLGLTTVALTGGSGGALAAAAEEAFVVQSRETARIQETHITLGHALCALVEDLVVEGSEVQAGILRKD
jgi:D-sedoheptulose 7-phosphate isomerase